MKRRAADPQNLRDAATLLPITATILLLPPFILVFAAPVLLAGIPLIVVYVFGAWAIIVLCAGLLARHLAKAPDAAYSDGDAKERFEAPLPDDRR